MSGWGYADQGSVADWEDAHARPARPKCRWCRDDGWRNDGTGVVPCDRCEEGRAYMPDEYDNEGPEAA